MSGLRMAGRRLRRRPGRSAVAVVTLALGIGASTAAFSAVAAVLLAPLPVQDQDDLIVLWRENPTRGFIHLPFTPAGVTLVEREVPGLEAAAGFDVVERRSVASLDDQPFDLTYRRVTGAFFEALGSRPAAGRLLTPDDDEYDAEPTMVLGHSLWVALGGSQDLVGASVSLFGREFRVVGVAEAGFEFPHGTQAWVSLRGSSPRPPPGRPGAEMDVVARLSGALPLEDVLDQARSIFLADPDQAEAAEPARFVATPFVEHVVGSFKPVVEAGMGVAMVLLWVAVANVTLLFLSGGAGTQREMAARRALGAPRLRVIAPLLADAALLAFLGVLGGVLLAGAVVELLLPLAPADLPRLDAVALDLGSMAFASSVAVLAVLGSGGIAGWWLSRGQPSDALVAGRWSGGARGEGLRRTIAVAQVGLAVVAATGASLLLRSVDQLSGLDRGFEPEGLYLVGLGHGHPIFEVPEEYPGQLRALSERLEAAPGVAGATPTLNLPLDFNGGVEMSPSLEGDGPDDPRSRPYVTLDAVLPNYLSVMGMRILTGRFFEPTDDASAERVVVVNETAAGLLWPGEGALGQRIGIYPGEPESWGTVVGVVADNRYRSFTELRPAVWVPVAQYASIPPGIMTVRTVGSGVPVRDLMVDAVAEVVPSARVLTVTSVAQELEKPLMLPRFAAAVVIAGALVTLLLAALGVYGVFAVLVQERRQELGLRRALGARGGDIVGLVARRLAVVGLFGTALGLMASLWLTPTLEELLFEVSVVDPWTLATVFVAVLLVVVVSGAHPARRALRVDPARTLRAE